MERRAATSGTLVALALSACLSRAEFGRHDVVVGDDRGCESSPASCPPGVWYDLGGSDMGSRDEYLVWGSASGGGISNDGGGSSSPSLALDTLDRPVVAWVNNVFGTSEIYVRRFDGTRWVELGTGSATGGGISNNSGWSLTPHLALDTSGNPVVAWHDSTSGNSEIYVRRFDGSRWVEVGTNSGSGGGISNDSSASYNPTLVLDTAGNPVVAWEDGNAGNSEIYLRRFDDMRWVEIGAGSASGGGISGNSGWSHAPSLTLDPSGNAMVAWYDDSSGNDEIYARRFDGSTWVEIGVGSATGGGVSNSAGSSYDPSLAVDASGNPVLAWVDDTTGNYEICARQFDGSTWVEIGVGSATDGGISNNDSQSWHPSLAFNAAGDAVVTWQENTIVNAEIYVRRFDGTSWVELGARSATGGGISNNDGLSYAPSLAFDAAGLPVVAWSDAAGGHGAGGGEEIYLRRFDGEDWTEMGTQTAAGGGISDSGGRSSSPSVALDPEGNPVVAWQDDTGGNEEIYVRRFEATRWVELGVGSATSGGISNSSGRSRSPDLALDASGIPVVAWHDDTSGNYEIYVRRFDGTSWVELGGSSATGGGISNNSGSSNAPALAFNAAGEPVVAWDDGTSYANEIYVRRFDGAGWVEVGAGSATGGGISDTDAWSSAPSLVLDASGNAVVAWTENTGNLSGDDHDIFVRRFDGVSWVEVGTGSATGMGISNNSGSSALASLALDAAGLPIVAWQDDASGPYNIYLRRFDGIAWMELGTGSASGGGLSNNSSSASHSASLALDTSGHPAVVWCDDISGNPEIYARRFDGTTWVDVGLASSTDGGVSSSGARSASPSVAMAAGRMCIAWEETGASSAQIVLRCVNVR